MDEMDEVPDIGKLSFETTGFLRGIDLGNGRYTRFLNLKEILGPADVGEFGVMAANCFTPEMMRAVLKAAFYTSSPVIIEISESQVSYALKGKGYEDKLSGYMDDLVKEVSDLARKTEWETIPPVCAHIDHLQKDENLAYAARDAGFTSVELDFSKQDTTDRIKAAKLNAEKCKPIIRDLHGNGISVEVEEGEIGDAAAREAQTEQEIINEITRPEYVVPLVKGTNPEAVAIFIGAAHGEFKKKPVIVYKAIGDVRRALRKEGIDKPVVLHGGTGQTHEGFRTAVHYGARKFNYASRWWTILENNLKGNKTGNAILEEMTRFEKDKAEKAGKKPKGSRYVFADFREQLYRDVSQDVFKKAECEMYDHAVELMCDAFGSAGKARLYQFNL